MDFIVANEEIFLDKSKQFADLYNVCFPQTMDEAEIKWRYLDSKRSIK